MKTGLQFLKSDINIKTDHYKQMEYEFYSAMYTVHHNTRGYFSKMRFDTKREANKFYKSINLN